MQHLLKEHTTPDGSVTFVMLPRTTIDVEITQNQLDRALPDYNDANATAGIQNVAFAYKLCLAHTDEIRFNNVDQDSEWHDFKVWWEEGKTRSEADKWKAFRTTFGRDEINEWADAFRATRAQRGKAPETLHPGAEQRAEGDEDFLEGVSATSVSGGSSSGALPMQKPQSKQKQPA